MTHAVNGRPSAPRLLTADDIAGFVIPEVRKGADWTRVQMLRESAAHTVAELTRRLDLANERVHQVQSELRARNAGPPPSGSPATLARPDEIPPGVVRAMTAAQRHADDLVAQAQREAGRIVADAQAQAETILNDVARRAERAHAEIDAARIPGPADVMWLSMAHGTAESIARQAYAISQQATHAAQTLAMKLAEVDGDAAQPAPSANGRHGPA